MSCHLMQSKVEHVIIVIANCIEECCNIVKYWIVMQCPAMCCSVEQYNATAMLNDVMSSNVMLNLVMQCKVEKCIANVMSCDVM